MYFVSFCKQFVFEHCIKLKLYFKRQHGGGVLDLLIRESVTCFSSLELQM